MISQERQETFGWLIALDTFVAGAGAGAFLISFILDLLGIYEPVAEIGTLLGPVLVLVGSFFLMIDVSRRTRIYRLLANPSSWMSRGVLILAVFIIFGLAYSLTSFGVPDFKVSALGRSIGIIGALLAFLVAVYPGFLFGVIKSVPFWNVSILPVLFFLSSLYTGIAVLLLTGPFLTSALGADGFHQLGAAGIGLIFMQLLVLGIYLEIARHSGVSAAESVRLLKTPLFIGGTILVGLLAPSGLLFYNLVLSDTLALSVLAGVSSVFLLVGGLLLRYSIIRAGVYPRLLIG